MGVFVDMTGFISRFNNELIGWKNAVIGETPRLQSQRTRNDTRRAAAVRQFGRVFVARPAVAAATASESTGKLRVYPLECVTFLNPNFSSP